MNRGCCSRARLVYCDRVIGACTEDACNVDASGTPPARFPDKHGVVMDTGTFLGADIGKERALCLAARPYGRAWPSASPGKSCTLTAIGSSRVTRSLEPCPPNRDITLSDNERRQSLSTRRHPAVDVGGPALPNSRAVRRGADEEPWREPRHDHRVGTPSGAAEQTRPSGHHPARHAVQPSPPGPARRNACAQRQATSRPLGGRCDGRAGC